MPDKSKHALAEEITHISKGLAIYKVGASPFWQVRIRDRKAGRYIVRSTKETSKIKARDAAVELAADILSKERPVERQFTFQYYADRLITRSAGMVARGERNANYVKTLKLCIDNAEWGLMRSFKHQDVREIRTRHYQEFMEALAKKRPDLSTSTRNTITATLRNVLKVARDDGVIDSLPSTPRTAQRDNPRSHFPFAPLVDKEEDLYQRILATAKRLAGEGRVVRWNPITAELYDLIIFITHTFVRPISSELYALRHADVAEAENPRRLILTVRDGKTGFRRVNTMQAAASVFERIKARNPEAKPTDYLFFPSYQNRETAAKIVQRQFKVVLEEAGIRDDPAAGIKYTLYSLRHTAICMRLVHSEGAVNIYTLAKTAGTSVEQIERFYAKSLPLSAGMALNLQYFGPGHGGKPPAKPTSAKGKAPVGVAAKPKRKAKTPVDPLV